ncbi:uncharacterized protein LOC126744222 [Anthonomus grandis grandis]|uniref:uncharacterized protein LOC126744222 n=1 Tax=Anthonomus grandis grandis TaxID=2921223 RepID=UPI0021665064|nr:uncharacterized protein LOC126744222 [Anthonomus grandis grandis]
MKFQVSLIGFICLGVLSVGVFANNLEQYDDQKLRGIIDGMINTTINNILSNLNESIEVPILTLNLNQSLLSGSANIVNFNLTGIKELVATQINVSILSLAMNASIKIPLIQLDTAYNASFILAKFFPLFGDGAVNATINDIDVLVGGKVNLTGGLSLSKVTVSFGIQTAQVLLWNILIGTALTKLTSNCQGGGELKYLWGDALSDNPNCVGPTNRPYPTDVIEKSFKNDRMWQGHFRTARSQRTIDPYQTRKALLKTFEQNSIDLGASSPRQGRASTMFSNTCGGMPPRLCKTRYNTTAPMYGVSLTSGQPVTIVQKFPDLLQQVVFEVCESSECDMVRGECMQTYVPYLFLVIPLGPVTLTGQDYVLVESGCVCRPKNTASNQTLSKV